MIIATNLLVGIIEAKTHIGDKEIITKVTSQGVPEVCILTKSSIQ